MSNSEPPISEMIIMGTGTSVGVPVAGCQCAVCRSQNPKNQRTRTGVLIRGAQGEFIIDAGPELRLQLIREDARLIQAAVFTHAHADHILGLDDLRIFGYQMNAAVPLYCEEPVEAQIRQVFSYALRTQRLIRISLPPRNCDSNALFLVKFSRCLVCKSCQFA